MAALDEGAGPIRRALRGMITERKPGGDDPASAASLAPLRRDRQRPLTLRPEGQGQAEN
jgi:hypothetical protein